MHWIHDLNFHQKAYITIYEELMAENQGSRMLMNNDFAQFHGPLAGYVKLRVAHAPGMPRTFSLPPTLKENAIQRYRHASRHVRDARAVMHVGIANPRWKAKTFLTFGGHAQPTILRIWQEAHMMLSLTQRGPVMSIEGLVDVSLQLARSSNKFLHV